MATIKTQVDGVFERLASGKLTAPTSAEQSGWEVLLPNGATVVRSALQAEAQPLIALGRQAIPDLLRWVMDERRALSYVAIFALEQITGEKPYISYFAKDDKDGFRTKAIESWKKWYEANTIPST